MEKYQKIKLVGRGAHGTVHLCARKRDGQRVIVKQIPVDSMTAAEREAALGEVQILQILNHPNIIGYYENLIEDNILCIVMQYAEGGTLADLIQDQKGILIEEEKILHLFAQILLSLHHLHAKQILHRDLKTQNILLNKNRDVCKLSDFGISKVLLTGKSKASTVIGTPSYLSPEICNNYPYDQKSDIWALGCILYEMMTLKKAFESETLAGTIMKITKGEVRPISDAYTGSLKKLSMQMLSLDPNKRPTTTEILANPIIIPAIFYLVTDLGSLPGCSPPPSPRTPRKLKTGSVRIDTP